MLSFVDWQIVYYVLVQKPAKSITTLSIPPDLAVQSFDVVDEVGSVLEDGEDESNALKGGLLAAWKVDDQGPVLDTGIVPREHCHGSD